MAFVAHLYNDVNEPQQTHGNSLIDTLLKNNPKKHFDIILDIGCGSGNVTEQLNQRIPHNKIVALDIDPQMIEFARNNYSSNTIEYMTQDISESWDELSTTFKELEAKVSLIFSNRVLHWIEDKETAAKNISRLLAIGGDVYINVSAIRDLMPYLSHEFNKNFIKMPSIGEQFEIWRNLLISFGIELSFADNFYAQSYYDRNAISVIWPAIPKLYKIYVKSKDEEVREKVINDSTFKEVVYDSTFCWRGQFKTNAYQQFIDSEANGVTLHYGQFRFIGKKVNTIFY